MGTSKSADQILKGSGIAAIHASFVWKKGSFYLTDVSSSEQEATLVRLAPSKELSHEASVEVGDIWCLAKSNDPLDGVMLAVQKAQDTKLYEEIWRRACVKVSDIHSLPYVFFGKPGWFSGGRHEKRRNSRLFSLSFPISLSSFLAPSLPPSLPPSLSSSPPHPHRAPPSAFYRLNTVHTDIGRRPDCELAINDYDLAPLHSAVIPMPPRYFLEPMATNKRKGTYLLLGRAPFCTKRPIPIKKGDIFRLGKSQFEVTALKAPKPKLQSQSFNKHPDELVDGSELHFSDLMQRGEKEEDDDTFDEANEGTMMKKMHAAQKKKAAKAAGKAASRPKSMDHAKPFEPPKLKYGKRPLAVSLRREDEGGRKGGVRELGTKRIICVATNADLRDLFASSRFTPYSPPHPQNEKFKALDHYIVLKLVTGPSRKVVYGLDQDMIIIGNAKDSDTCTIYLNDERLSAYNTLIEYRDGVYYLSDLESDDGTFWRLPDDDYYRLELGDVVRIGRTELVVYGDVYASARPSSICSVL